MSCGYNLMNYTLLPASDASAVAVDITAALLSKQWGGSLAARKAQLLQKNFNWLLVDSIDPNCVVGHVKLTPSVQTSSDIYGTAPSGILTSVVINEAHRGKGIGTLLMRAIEEQALMQGYCTLILWTPDAMNFYSKLGYIPCEPRRALTTLVTSIESISAKSISKLEQLFAKRTASTVDSTQLDDQPGGHDSNTNDAQQMVWMQKRIRDEMPLQDIAFPTLVQSIQKSLANTLSYESAEGAVLYLHCCSSSTSPDATRNLLTLAASGSTELDSLTLPWAQQVGPSCGIQAIRFAEHILKHANNHSHMVRCALSSALLPIGQTGSVEVSNVCDGTPASLHPAVHRDVSVGTCSVVPSVLSLAIERQYTEQGAIYNIHHIGDLLHRNQDTSISETSQPSIEAHVASAQSLTAGQFCNLLMGYPPVLNTNIDSITNTNREANPACVILPYDRDSTHSTPCCKDGVAAHYALVCGFIILPAAIDDQSESYGCSSDWKEPIDELIDPARLLLVAMHGLTWQPIVASYADFMASNAQLRCAEEKLVFNNHEPNLKGNMVVVRRIHT
eukprot:gene11055-12888_t